MAEQPQPTRRPPQAGSPTQTWQKRLAIAQKEREPHEAIWQKTWQQIAGRHYRAGLSPIEAQPMNLFNNFVRVVLPHLLPRNAQVEIAVSPRRVGSGYAESAEQLADRVNALLPQIRFTQEVRRALRSAMHSVGILKIGQNTRSGQVSKVPSTKRPEELVTVDQDFESAEAREYLDPGLPFVSWVRPTRFYPDPAGSCLDECRWVAHKIFRTAESLRLDPRFAKVRDRIQGNCDGKTLSALRRDHPEEDPALGMVGLYEIYDRSSRSVLWLPVRGDDAIWAEGDWPAGVEGFPFAVLSYDAVEEYFWPNPILAPTFDGMDSVNTIFTGLIEGVKAMRRLVGYDSNELKPAQLTSIVNSCNGSIVGIPGLGRHVQQLELGGSPMEVWNAAAVLKQTVDEQNGIAEFHRGVTGGSKRTATEVQTALAMSGVRLDDLKGATHDMIAEACQMIAGLLVAHQDMYADLQLPLDRGDGQTRIIALGPGVEGEFLDYMFEVVSSSTERVDPAIKQKRTQDLLTLSIEPAMAQKLQSENRTLRTSELLEEFLRSLGIRDPGRYVVELQQQPGGGEDPEAKAEQENAKMLQRGEPAPVQPHDLHDAEMAVHEQAYQQTGSEAIALHLMMHAQAAQAGQVAQPRWPSGPDDGPMAGLHGPPPMPGMGGQAVMAAAQAAADRGIA